MAPIALASTARPTLRTCFSKSPLQRARGKVLRACRDARRDFGQGQVVVAQDRGRNLDPDLLVAGAEHAYLVDARRQQRVAHVLGERLQRGLGDRAREDQPRDRVVEHHPLDDRRLGVLGEGRDATERGIDVGERGLHVGPGLELDQHRGRALDRERDHLLYRIEKPHLGSTASTMLASTSSAPAPGQAICTVTKSMPKVGNSWVFILASATAPVTMARIASKWRRCGGRRKARSGPWATLSGPRP